MTDKDSERLARIRADNEQWKATTEEAFEWDTSFLLRIIDELLAAKASRKTISV